VAFRVGVQRIESCTIASNLLAINFLATKHVHHKNVPTIFVKWTAPTQRCNHSVMSVFRFCIDVPPSCCLSTALHCSIGYKITCVSSTSPMSGVHAKQNNVKTSKATAVIRLTSCLISWGFIKDGLMQLVSIKLNKPSPGLGLFNSRVT